MQQPITLLNTPDYTVLAGIQNFAVAPVISAAVPLHSTENCRCSYGCMVLPVTLLSFDGVRQNIENVLLHWETTNEYQNTGFNVERSLGTATFFNTVAFVTAQLNNSTKKKYALNDPNNYDGISYYRLKQIDLDGNFTYSKIITVSGYSHKPTLKLYPNPAVKNMVVETYFAKSGNAKLWITDAAQKLLLVHDFSYNKGSNFITVPVSSLSSGLYFVKILNNDNVLLNGKFIVE
ncbi:MAG: T9SS type A sorting domain-containing protein [Ferruginibacter sp.]|nr:T9SS type A sorting domain-containing protein [Ferruginibacter sp.]